MVKHYIDLQGREIYSEESPSKKKNSQHRYYCAHHQDEPLIEVTPEWYRYSDDLRKMNGRSFHCPVCEESYLRKQGKGIRNTSPTETP
jgi:hypothetical protein